MKINFCFVLNSSWLCFGVHSRVSGMVMQVCFFTMKLWRTCLAFNGRWTWNFRMGHFLLKIGYCKTMVSNSPSSLARAEPISFFLAASLGLHKRHPALLLFNHLFSIRPLWEHSSFTLWADESIFIPLLTTKVLKAHWLFPSFSGVAEPVIFTELLKHSMAKGWEVVKPQVAKNSPT